MAYWDTSCVLKIYAREPDSSDFEAHLLNEAALVTSEVTRLELFAALKRKEALGELDSGDASRAFAAFNRHIKVGLVSLVAVNSAVLAEYEIVIDKCYCQVPPLLLRTLDALHVASALVSGESEMVTVDKRLRDAASVAGLSLFPHS